MSSVLVFCCCWCCCCGCFWCCRRRKTSSAVIYSNRLEESRQEKNRASRYTAPWANALDALVDPLERRGRRCLCARIKHGRTHPYSRRRCLLLFIIIPLDELFHLNWTLKPYSHIQQIERHTHTHEGTKGLCDCQRQCDNNESTTWSWRMRKRAAQERARHILSLPVQLPPCILCNMEIFVYVIIPWIDWSAITQ